MAFLAPQRQQPQRPHHVHPLLDTSVQQTPQDTQPAREWVLFSPYASSGAETATISTAHTARTLGRSVLSELDSLQTRASRHAGEDHDINEDEETEDLDSLDDGLHAFAVPGRPLHDSDTVLPVHDGLGTFAVQEQLWQHERYNPNRRRRPSAARRSSSQQMRRSNNVAAIVEEDNNREAEQETWRMKRIEEWRLEQSRAILEEIEKETRRLRRTTTSSRSETTNLRKTMSQERATAAAPPPQPVPAHSQQSSSSAPADEGFWTHFTRRVIQDLIGIDDATLCYIFGEDLAGEDDTPLSSTPRQSDILAPPPPRNDLELARTGSSWEERLIARIARELGILVGQLTEHPGALSTYQEIQEEHISYAGSTTSAVPRHASSSSSIPTTSSPFSPEFEPTMQRAHRPALGNVNSASHWGVEDSPSTTSLPQHDREHWERDLDVRAVFNFIRNRLLRRRAASPSAQRPSTATAQAQASSYTTRPQRPHQTASTATSPTNASRAALIRAHHPLISSPRASTQRRPLSPVVSVPQALGSVLGRRVLSESSCASQSSKRTRTSASVSRSTNYWDWAGPDGVAGWGEA